MSSDIYYFSLQVILFFGYSMGLPLFEKSGTKNF